MTTIDVQATWVFEATSCTLPTVDKPLRLAEFDQLFTNSTLAVTRGSDTRASLVLRPESAVAAMAADLSLRETQCCSFFEFTLTMTGSELTLSVTVPDARVPVLDALVERATAASQQGTA